MAGPVNARAMGIMGEDGELLTRPYNNRSPFENEFASQIFGPDSPNSQAYIQEITPSGLEFLLNELKRLGTEVPMNEQGFTAYGGETSQGENADRLTPSVAPPNQEGLPPFTMDIQREPNREPIQYMPGDTQPQGGRSMSEIDEAIALWHLQQQLKKEQDQQALGGLDWNPDVYPGEEIRGGRHPDPGMGIDFLSTPQTLNSGVGEEIITRPRETTRTKRRQQTY